MLRTAERKMGDYEAELRRINSKLDRVKGCSKGFKASRRFNIDRADAMKGRDSDKA